MDQKLTKLTFNAEDIFQEIDGDPDNIMMKFPDEVLEQTGWKEGDVLNIKLEDGAIVITKNG